MTRRHQALAARSAVVALVVGITLLALATPAGAHAFGRRRDLPLPAWLFFTGGGTAVVFSFLALGFTWRTTRLERPFVGWALPRPVQAAAPVLAVITRVLGLVLFAGVFVTAATGENTPDFNAAPRAVYVVFWVGMTLVSAFVGDLWRLLSPFETVYAVIRWARGSTAEPGPDPEGSPGGFDLGYWPAAVLLFGFVMLELGVFQDAAEPHFLATAMAVYTLTIAAGAAIGGPRALREGEAFAAWFGLLAHMAPCYRDDDGCLRLRPPLVGLTKLRPRPGQAAVVLVALGTTSFDGLTRTPFWVNLTAGQSQQDRLLSDTLGMAWMVAVVGILFFGAMRMAARITDQDPDELGRSFIHSLVPIALGYAIAHYFSFLLVETNRFIGQISDPLGRGWDIFGTIGWVDNLNVVPPSVIAYVQAGAIVFGHMAGVLLAHDRAVARFQGETANRSQYPLLLAMVGYTVGGLALLLSG